LTSMRPLSRKCRNGTKTLGPRCSGLLRILQVGCGTSELSEKIYDSGFANITNVDIDAPTIEEMQKRHQDARPEMQWLVADMTDTSAVFPAGECFEVAIDKGTLDAMLCTDDGSSLYCEVLASPCSVSRVA